MQEGNDYITISTEHISEYDWANSPTTFYLFMHLLIKARQRDTLWNGITLHRGQLVACRRVLSEELNISEQQIRTALARLKKCGCISLRPTNKYTIITICEYDGWTGNRQKPDRPEKPVVINDLDGFDECWKAYNRKGSKKKAVEQWQRLTAEERSKVLPHVKAYVGSREKQYQKDFERYLRDRTFEEVIIKGNETVYDPEKFSNAQGYHPTTDGFFQYWNEDRKCLMFNGYIDQLNDGYTKDNRPDGATVAWQMYMWTWNSSQKKWIKHD